MTLNKDFVYIYKKNEEYKVLKTKYRSKKKKKD